MTLSQGEIPALDGPEDAISAKKISGHSAKTAVLEILSQEMLAKADSPPIPAIMEKEPLSMSSKVAAGNENLILASQHNTPWKCVTRCSPTNYNMVSDDQNPSKGKQHDPTEKPSSKTRDQFATVCVGITFYFTIRFSIH